MARALAEGVALFLLPFVLFGAWIVFRHGRGGAKDAFGGAFSWLSIAGLVLAIAAIVLGAALREPHRGAYTPAELKDGVVVPGRVQ